MSIGKKTSVGTPELNTATELQGPDYNTINVVAESVEDNGNGTFAIRVPGRKMTESERAFLHALFPNTMDRAYGLLDTEQLIGAIATEAQIRAPKQERSRFPN